MAVNTDEGRVSTLNFDFSRPATDPHIPTLEDDLVELDEPAAAAGADSDDGGISLNLDLEERPRVSAAASKLSTSLEAPRPAPSPSPAKGLGTRSLEPESAATPPLGVALRGPAAAAPAGAPGSPGKPAAGTSGGLDRSRPTALTRDGRRRRNCHPLQA